MLVHLLQHGAALGIRRRDHVAIHVAAGGDGIEQHRVHPLDERLHVALQHAVKLEGLARGDAQGRPGDLAGEIVEHQPLLRRSAATGQAHPEHKGKRLLLAGFLQRIPHIAVILQVEAVKFGELVIVVTDRTGGEIRHFLGDGAAQMMRGGF